MKLLLIDDDETILDLVGQFLSLTSNCTVQSALSAKAALEIIAEAQRPFDCLLVDIQMPEVDGITLIGLVRKIPAYRYTPIIMLTAMRERRYLDRAFSAGATDYVTKPIDFMDLQRRLGAAQQLSSEKAKHHGEPLTAGKPREYLVEEPKEFRLEDPIALSEVDTSIDCAEFENYLRQLQRRRLFRASTIVVRVGSADRLHRELSSEEFSTLLHNVASAVQKVLLADGGVFSYCGSGVYVCVPESCPRDSRDDLEARLNRRYHVLYPPNGRIGIWLHVGEPVPLCQRLDVNALVSSGQTKARHGTCSRLCPAKLSPSMVCSFGFGIRTAGGHAL